MGGKEGAAMEESIISRKTVYTGSFIRLEKTTIGFSDGTTASRDILRHPGASAVVALDAEGNITLVSQRRTPLEKDMVEIPAGKLDKGEDPMDCARRELEEETGCRAGDLLLLTSFHPSPAICDECIHIYLARNPMEGIPRPDEGENITVLRVPLEKAMEMVSAGDITDGKTIIGILLAHAAG
jgi:ADP-ribose pyrophosphatase